MYSALLTNKAEWDGKFCNFYLDIGHIGAPSNQQGRICMQQEDLFNMRMWKIFWYVLYLGTLSKLCLLNKCIKMPEYFTFAAFQLMLFYCAHKRSKRKRQWKLNGLILKYFLFRKLQARYGFTDIERSVVHHPDFWSLVTKIAIFIFYLCFQMS